MDSEKDIYSVLHGIIIENPGRTLCGLRYAEDPKLKYTEYCSQMNCQGCIDNDLFNSRSTKKAFDFIFRNR